MTVLRWADLGRVPYAPTLALQERLVEEARQADDRDCLLLCEHDPPAITLGRRGLESDLLLGEDRRNDLGVEVHATSRGGEVTVHAPGQLVGYPIVRLDRRGRNVRGFIRNLEETLIVLLGRFGIDAGRREAFTGVWVGQEKIAAIGVAVRRWVSFHGFALNVCTDLSVFDWIVPCGIRDRSMTSMHKLLGREITVADVLPPLLDAFCEVFGFEGVEPFGPEDQESV